MNQQVPDPNKTETVRGCIKQLPGMSDLKQPIAISFGHRSARRTADPLMRKPNGPTLPGAYVHFSNLTFQGRRVAALKILLVM